MSSESGNVCIAEQIIWLLGFCFLHDSDTTNIYDSTKESKIYVS